jgi:hypothetical protein
MTTYEAFRDELQKIAGVKKLPSPDIPKLEMPPDVRKFYKGGKNISIPETKPAHDMLSQHQKGT